jgi:prepilin-type processing-associated H-X9-DG protein
VDPRHDDRAATIFTDGHAEILTPEELGYECLADGT